MRSSFVPLQDLEVYQLARALSQSAWSVYEGLSWEDKKIMGDQFIRAIDSVGANIAEGYRRYHYLDKIKFYYNSRASLSEGCSHWLQLLFERGKIKKGSFQTINEIKEKLSLKLSNFINATYQAKDQPIS
jgi:four helix bundle protein